MHYIRLVVLGDSQVGKTSLIRQLVGEELKFEPEIKCEADIEAHHARIARTWLSQLDEHESEQKQAIETKRLASLLESQIELQQLLLKQQQRGNKSSTASKKTPATTTTTTGATTTTTTSKPTETKTAGRVDDQRESNRKGSQPLASVSSSNSRLEGTDDRPLASASNCRQRLEGLAGKSTTTVEHQRAISSQGGSVVNLKQQSDALTQKAPSDWDRGNRCQQQKQCHHHDETIRFHNDPSHMGSGSSSTMKELRDNKNKTRKDPWSTAKPSTVPSSSTSSSSSSSSSSTSSSSSSSTSERPSSGRQASSGQQNKMHKSELGSSQTLERPTILISSSSLTNSATNLSEQAERENEIRNLASDKGGPPLSSQAGDDDDGLSMVGGAKRETEKVGPAGSTKQQQQHEQQPSKTTTATTATTAAGRLIENTCTSIYDSPLGSSGTARFGNTSATGPGPALAHSAADTNESFSSTINQPLKPDHEPADESSSSLGASSASPPSSFSYGSRYGAGGGIGSSDPPRRGSSSMWRVEQKSEPNGTSTTGNANHVPAGKKRQTTKQQHAEQSVTTTTEQLKSNKSDLGKRETNVGCGARIGINNDGEYLGELVVDTTSSTLPVNPNSNGRPSSAQQSFGGPAAMASTVSSSLGQQQHLGDPPKRMAPDAFEQTITVQASECSPSSPSSAISSGQQQQKQESRQVLQLKQVRSLDVGRKLPTTTTTTTTTTTAATASIATTIATTTTAIATLPGNTDNNDRKDDLAAPKEQPYRSCSPILQQHRHSYCAPPTSLLADARQTTSGASSSGQWGASTVHKSPSTGSQGHAAATTTSGGPKDELSTQAKIINILFSNNKSSTPTTTTSTSNQESSGSATASGSGNKPLLMPALLRQYQRRLSNFHSHSSHQQQHQTNNNSTGRPFSGQKQKQQQKQQESASQKGQATAAADRRTSTAELMSQLIAEERKRRAELTREAAQAAASLATSAAAAAQALLATRSTIAYQNLTTTTTTMTGGSCRPSASAAASIEVGPQQAADEPVERGQGGGTATGGASCEPDDLAAYDNETDLGSGCGGGGGGADEYDDDDEDDGGDRLRSLCRFPLPLSGGCHSACWIRDSHALDEHSICHEANLYALTEEYRIKLFGPRVSSSGCQQRRAQRASHERGQHQKRKLGAGNDESAACLMHLPTTAAASTSSKYDIKHFCSNYIDNLNLYEIKIIDMPTIEPSSEFPTSTLLEWSLFKGRSHLLTADAYLLVFDLTRPSTIQYIKMLRDKIFESREMSNVPVYVIANKADLCPTLQPSLQARQMRNVAVRRHQASLNQPGAADSSSAGGGASTGVAGTTTGQQQQSQSKKPAGASNSQSPANSSAIPTEPKWRLFGRSGSNTNKLRPKTPLLQQAPIVPPPTTFNLAGEQRSVPAAAAHQLLTAYKMHRMRLGGAGPIVSLRRWAQLRRAVALQEPRSFVDSTGGYLGGGGGPAGGGPSSTWSHFERKRMHYSLIVGASGGFDSRTLAGGSDTSRMGKALGRVRSCLRGGWRLIRRSRASSDLLASLSSSSAASRARIGSRLVSISFKRSIAMRRRRRRRRRRRHRRRHNRQHRRSGGDGGVRDRTELALIEKAKRRKSSVFMGPFASWHHQKETPEERRANKKKKKKGNKKKSKSSKKSKRKDKDKDKKKKSKNRSSKTKSVDDVLESPSYTTTAKRTTLHLREASAKRLSWSRWLHFSAPGELTSSEHRHQSGSNDSNSTAAAAAASTSDGQQQDNNETVKVHKQTIKPSASRMSDLMPATWRRASGAGQKQEQTAAASGSASVSSTNFNGKTTGGILKQARTTSQTPSAKELNGKQQRQREQSIEFESIEPASRRPSEPRSSEQHDSSTTDLATTEVTPNNTPSTASKQPPSSPVAPDTSTEHNKQLQLATFPPSAVSAASASQRPMVEPICGAMSTPASRQTFYELFNKLLQTSSTMAAKTQLKMGAISAADQQQADGGESATAADNGQGKTRSSMQQPSGQLDLLNQVVGQQQQENRTCSQADGKRTKRRKSSSTGAVLWQTLSSLALSRISQSTDRKSNQQQQETAKGTGESGGVGGGGHRASTSLGGRLSVASRMSAGSGATIFEDAEQQQEQQQKEKDSGVGGGGPHGAGHKRAPTMNDTLACEGLRLGTDQYLSIDMLRKLSLISSHSQLSAGEEASLAEPAAAAGQQQQQLADQPDDSGGTHQMDNDSKRPKSAPSEPASAAGVASAFRRASRALNLGHKHHHHHHQNRKQHDETQLHDPSDGAANEEAGCGDIAGQPRAHTSDPAQAPTMGARRFWYRGVVKKILFHSNKQSLKGIVTAMELQRKAEEATTEPESAVGAVENLGGQDEGPAKGADDEQQQALTTPDVHVVNAETHQQRPQTSGGEKSQPAGRDDDDAESDRTQTGAGGDNTQQPAAGLQARRQSLTVVQSAAPSIRIISSGSSLSLISESNTNNNNRNNCSLGSGTGLPPSSRHSTQALGPSTDGPNRQTDASGTRTSAKDESSTTSRQQESVSLSSAHKTMSASSSATSLATSGSSASLSDSITLNIDHTNKPRSLAVTDTALNSGGGGGSGDSIDETNAEDEEEEEEEEDVDDEEDDDNETPQPGAQLKPAKKPMDNGNKDESGGGGSAEENSGSGGDDDEDDDDESGQMDGLAEPQLTYQLRKLSADDCLIINRHRRQSLAAMQDEKEALEKSIMKQRAQQQQQQQQRGAEKANEPEVGADDDATGGRQQQQQHLLQRPDNSSSGGASGDGGNGHSKTTITSINRRESTAEQVAQPAAAGEDGRRQSIKQSIEAAIHLLVPRAKPRSASITLGATDCERRSRSQLGTTIMGAVNVHKTWRDWRQLLGRKKSSGAAAGNNNHLAKGVAGSTLNGRSGGMGVGGPQGGALNGDKNMFTDGSPFSSPLLIGGGAGDNLGLSSVASPPIVGFLSSHVAYKKMTADQQREAAINFDQLMRINQLTLTAANVVMLAASQPPIKPLVSSSGGGGPNGPVGSSGKRHNYHHHHHQQQQQQQQSHQSNQSKIIATGQARDSASLVGATGENLRVAVGDTTNGSSTKRSKTEKSSRLIRKQKRQQQQEDLLKLNSGTVTQPLMTRLQSGGNLLRRKSSVGPSKAGGHRSKKKTTAHQNHGETLDRGPAPIEHKSSTTNLFEPLAPIDTSNCLNGTTSATSVTADLVRAQSAAADAPTSGGGGSAGGPGGSSAAVATAAAAAAAAAAASSQAPSVTEGNISAQIAAAAASALERQRRRGERISSILEPRYDKKQPGAEYPIFVSHDLNPILKDLAQLVRKHWKCNYIECSAASNWNIRPIISELTRALECNNRLSNSSSGISMSADDSERSQQTGRRSGGGELQYELASRGQHRSRRHRHNYHYRRHHLGPTNESGESDDVWSSDDDDYDDDDGDDDDDDDYDLYDSSISSSSDDTSSCDFISSDNSDDDDDDDDDDDEDQDNNGSSNEQDAASRTETGGASRGSILQRIRRREGTGGDTAAGATTTMTRCAIM